MQTKRSTSKPAPITTAMVLAAGFGSRMRPLTDTTPKPLVKLAGRPLLDHVLDRLADAGVEKAVVNVHYLAEQIEAHTQKRSHPAVTISDERGLILETGGGVKKALPMLGDAPFLVHNSDSVWSEGAHSNLAKMMAAWQAETMSALLLLAPKTTSIGFDGRGDFFWEPNGQLRRRGDAASAPYIFAGVSILKPQLFHKIENEAFSLNVIFDKAAASGALYGFVLDGLWMHVGTPDALIEAEERILELDRRSA